MKHSRADVCGKARLGLDIRFEAQNLTSYSGLILFQHFFSLIGIKERLWSCFRHLKVNPIYGHHVVMMLLVVHLIIGHRRLRDVDYYRDDAMVKRVLGLKRLPDVSTLSRSLASADAQSVDKVRIESRHLVMERLAVERFSTVTLDFDGSVLSTGRHAEGTAVGFNKKKKGARSYYPLFCTVAQTDQVLDVHHRPGNVHDSNGADPFAVETMRDWLSLYRNGGFEALYPKTRADRGQPRRLPPEVAELLVSLKTEQPALSVKALIGTARERGVDHPLAPSTVHRLLSREGLLDSRSGEPVATDRRRFAYRDAGELWMSDVMHGPKVSDGRRRRKTFLIAFIDDATRVLPFAAFAHSENTTAFLPVFKQAIARRGLPMRLFVDNGANYRSQQLALVCAKLGIALIHARPYQPAGKGKIERFFRTLRAAWLRHLTPEATTSLDTLNRTLWAWVEGEYHQSPHRGLDGRTPLDQWALAGHNVRYPDPHLDLDDLFLFEAKRRVMKDRTVSLHGRLYEVDAVLVGETVTLRYDPDAPPARPIEVVHHAKPAGTATRLDAYANTRVKRHRPSWQLQCDTPAREPDPSPLAMRNLKEKK